MLQGVMKVRNGSEVIVDVDVGKALKLEWVDSVAVRLLGLQLRIMDKLVGREVSVIEYATLHIGIM